LNRLIDAIGRADLEGLLVTDEVNVRYLSGFTGDSSYLLVQPELVTVISDGRYETQLNQECPELVHSIRPPDQTLMARVAQEIGPLGDSRLGFESDVVSVDMFNQMRKSCEHISWVETSGLVEELRAIKDEHEIVLIRQAIEVAERAFQSVIPKLRPDWTEIEIAHELEAAMRVLGAEGVSFSSIIGADAAGALPHYRPTAVRLGNSATLLMDFGAKFQGYASDITRTLASPRASDRFRRAYDAVLEAQLTAIHALGPGVATREVDQVARNVLGRHGLAEAFRHGLGHGIGLRIHEAPRLSALSQEVLQPGMVVTVEPGVYFAGEFGIRIEDDVLITESGQEILSRLPKGLEDFPYFD
jgi:Xaa-Pro aminopeptidase